jgi:hypothetical protein
MRNSRILRQNIPAQNTRLPLIGRIRCGEKRTNSAGKEYPVSLDYFVATGSYAAKFDEVYNKPDRIQVVFISDDDFQSCYEEWDGRDKEGRRAGYGDGVNYWLWDFTNKEEYKQTTDRNEILEFSKRHNIKWRQVLTINFIIPAIKGVFGVWQFQTGGDKSSIGAIRNTFDEIKEQAGTIVNIPFDLTVKKVTSNKPEAKSVYPVVSLIPNISAENMETLRAFFEAGLDIRKQGILNEQKLTALQEHAVVEIQPLEEAPPKKPAVPTNDLTHNDYVLRAIAGCDTLDELRTLYSNEPGLFMEDENTLLGKAYASRFNVLQNGK